ncbi:DUF4229 domain-containing protein [Myceligenerans salitolerans]|uniref:DUF4229 domain-containing protein n=1 Tax=Myceligenerans salitolerans TaxID=1230528 RepID=A0ABS3I710_9MICO|nr:DUF4229 domain-containing protein [Myceligenerans salitolerans]MBO0608796.1 DUF4229 domain-containing protein [Myceligenerans salitolerans]
MPLVTYTVLRLALFAGALGLLYLAGLRSWLLVGIAAVAAPALSYVLLRGPRDAAATWLADRRARRGLTAGAAADADAAHEDAVVDRATE